MTGYEVKFCPDLVTREERKAIAIGSGDIVISYFEHCLQNKCVAYKDGKCLKYKETVLITEGEE